MPARSVCAPAGGRELGGAVLRAVPGPHVLSSAVIDCVIKCSVSLLIPHPTSPPPRANTLQRNANSSALCSDRLRNKTPPPTRPTPRTNSVQRNSNSLGSRSLRPMPREDKQRQQQGTAPYARPHACVYCASAFGNAGNLKKHVRLVHEKRRDHVCPHCPTKLTAVCSGRSET